MKTLNTQISNTRSKIAAYRAAINNASDIMEAVDYNASYDAISADQDAFLAAKKTANRLGGEIKKMARKAIEMHFGSSCDWYKYDTVSGYINKFNEVFAGF